MIFCSRFWIQRNQEPGEFSTWSKSSFSPKEKTGTRGTLGRETEERRHVGGPPKGSSWSPRFPQGLGTGAEDRALGQKWEA